MALAHAVRFGGAVRRTALAVAAIACWANLGMMVYLADGTSKADLGPGGMFLPLCRSAFPSFTILVCGFLIILIRRSSYLCSGAVAMGLWLLDFVVRHRGCEHSHLLTMDVLFTYSIVGLLCGGPSAERTAWEACCAMIGAVYTLAGLSKLKSSGLYWINAEYLRLLVTSGSIQSAGAIHAIRIALGHSPLFAFAASAYTLLVELCGFTMLRRSWRPYYTTALLPLHFGFFLGMGIFWPQQIILVAALGLPLESLYLRFFRATPMVK